jgi:hypothetical protein
MGKSTFHPYFHNNALYCPTADLSTIFSVMLHTNCSHKNIATQKKRSLIKKNCIDLALHYYFSVQSLKEPALPYLKQHPIAWLPHFLSWSSSSNTLHTRLHSSLLCISVFLSKSTKVTTMPWATKQPWQQTFHHFSVMSNTNSKNKPFWFIL